ncbi:LysR family transcriptional regulator [Vallitalea okinawensis]|uniref:LysR family transcriptional regulator n=1 Tax=Vallitalea okinawensis TaxID=2078660 RepID=UPI001478367B|nr:LysR family transcriptional regulator [Vallitalea okinawensis]
MNIETLESFVLLSENRNFTKTAELQYVVQSTISNRINELEKFVGKELFIRDNKNVELTRAGKNFLPYAKRMLMLRTEGVIKARSTGIYDDRLAIGAVDSIYHGAIKDLVKEYFQHFPNIAVKLKINHSDEIIKLLGDEILDIGFVYHKPKLSKFEILPLKDDEIILVSSSVNKLIIRDQISSEELADIPLLYANLGEEFFRWLSEQLGDSPLLRLSTDSVTCTLDYVKAGLGWAFVPQSIVSKELDQGELIHVKIMDSSPPTKKIFMLINKTKKDTLALQKWLDLVNMN